MPVSLRLFSLGARPPPPLKLFSLGTGDGARLLSARVRRPSSTSSPESRPRPPWHRHDAPRASGSAPPMSAPRRSTSYFLGPLATTAPTSRWLSPNLGPSSSLSIPDVPWRSSPKRHSSGITIVPRASSFGARRVVELASPSGLHDLLSSSANVALVSTTSASTSPDSPSPPLSCGLLRLPPFLPSLR